MLPRVTLALGRQLDGRRRAGVRPRLDDAEVLHRFTEKLPQPHDTRRSHGDAGVDRHHTDASGAVDDDATGKVEIQFLLTRIEEHVVRVTRREILVFDLERDLLLLGGWGVVFGHKFWGGSGSSRAVPCKRFL